MYVCICNAVTEQAIKDAAREGVQTMKQLRETLGVATCCGRCAGSANKLLKECNMTCRSARQVASNPSRYVRPANNTAMPC
jgi:bacterioferritin-associated ferredoxin